MAWARAGRVGYLAFGTFLLLLGGTLAMTGVPLLLSSGWITIAVGAIFVVAHVAVGPRVGAPME